MSKHCTTFEHTADLGLEARADTLAELFEALGEGLAGQICPPAAVTGREHKSLTVQAGNREDLLHDFLGELLGLFDLEKFLVREVKVERIDEGAVHAVAAGETYDPARHELDAEIKAVTYHDLTVAQEADQWIGRVVLDI